jgi:hypothetical protein
MKVDSINRILEAVTGVRKDGGSYLVPEENDLSVYIGFGSEVLTVARVARVTPQAELVVIETAKGERFYFPPESIAGVKLGQVESKGPRSTGFR